jgi:hypothetical protein
MSKIFTLLAIAVFTSFAVSAQTSKGTVLLGGSLAFDHSKYKSGLEPGKTTNFAISPGISRFYRDNRLVGAGISYSRISGSQTGNQYGLNFFLRQYLPMGKEFFLFADETLSGSTSKSKSIGTSPRTDKNATVGVSFYPGLAYAINKNFQLEVSLPDMVALSYQHYQVKDQPNSNNTDTKTVNFKTGLSQLYLESLSFGVKVALN